MMNQDMMNPMMMGQNNGLMNLIGNNMMNQMKIQNMMMNQMNMMNQDNWMMMNQGMMMTGLDFNDNMAKNEMINNNMMMNQDNNNNIRNQNLNNLNKVNKLDIYCNETEYIYSISKNIFSENDDVRELRDKLLSINSNLKKNYIENQIQKR